MKKLIAVALTVSVAVVAGAAYGRNEKPVTNEEVERVIDARLHQMLVKLNQQR